MPRPTWQENQQSIDIVCLCVYSVKICTVHVEESRKFPKMSWRKHANHEKNREINYPSKRCRMSFIKIMLPLVCKTHFGAFFSSTPVRGLSPHVPGPVGCLQTSHFPNTLCILLKSTPAKSQNRIFVHTKMEAPKWQRRAWYFSFSDLYHRYPWVVP